MVGYRWIGVGAIVAAVGVAAGAMGAHFLQSRLTDSQLATYEVAVRYQMYHAFALMLVGVISSRRPSGWFTCAGLAFLMGIAGFSGSLYLWLATNLWPLQLIVPIGGMTWIVGWVLLAIGTFVQKPARSPAPGELPREAELVSTTGDATRYR